MEAGKVNCVICKNLSRMFRNYSDQGYFLEKIFPMYRVRFITVSDPKVDSYLHPETIQGLEIPINGLMNDRFAAKTSRDIRATFATKRRKGEFIGAFAPFGYRKDPQNKNTLVIDEEAAEVVRSIYRWFVCEGMSKHGIARRLNEWLIPNPATYKKRKGMKFYCPQADHNDGLWSPGSVSTILNNRMYTGTMVQGKQRVVSYKVHEKVAVPREEWYVVPDTHAPIIEAALFQQAAELQARDTRTASAEGKLHLLAGLMRCGDCRKAMTRQKTKRLAYYYCRTFREKSPVSCTRHGVKEEAVICAALAMIQAQLSLVDMSREGIEMLKKTWEHPGEVTCRSSARNLCRRELAKVTRLVDGLHEDWKNGDLSREEYLRLKETYRKRAGKLRDSLQSLEAEEKERGKNGAEADPNLAYFLEHHNLKELNRGILVGLVGQICVYRGGRICMEFRFADPYCLAADREDKADRKAGRSTLAGEAWPVVL